MKLVQIKILQIISKLSLTDEEKQLLNNIFDYLYKKTELKKGFDQILIKLLKSLDEKDLFPFIDLTRLLILDSKILQQFIKSNHGI